MSFTIEVPGKPISKKRHRNNGSHYYDPQEKEKKFLRDVLKKHAYIQKWDYDDTGRTAYEVEFDFRFPIPNSATKCEQNLASWGECNYLIKNDLDNLEKFYCDVMNGVVYHDDSQITSIVSNKCYSTNPGTKITVTAYKKLDPFAADILSMMSKDDLQHFLVHSKMMHDYLNANNDAKIPDNILTENLQFAVVSLCSIAVNHADKLQKIKKICRKPLQ